MASYWEKLKDPRWQRKRLEILERSEFTCEECGSGDKTLHVHHKIYRKNAEPWAYAEDDLIALCEECHERFHDLKARLNEGLKYLSSYEYEFLLGYVQGLSARGNPEVICAPRNYEEACGVGDAFLLSAHDVIDGLEDGFINGHGLFAIRQKILQGK